MNNIVRQKEFFLIGCILKIKIFASPVLDNKKTALLRLFLKIVSLVKGETWDRLT